MQWSLIAVIHIVNALFGSSCASADDGKGQISNVFEAFGYSPACVASALTSCEYSSTKELSVDVVDSMEVTKSLLQEMKSERENSATVVKTLLQELKSEVQAVRQEMRSEIQAVRQEMQSEEKNSLSLLQEIKSEIRNSASAVKSICQDKSDGEESASIVKTLLQDMKSEVQADHQYLKSEVQAVHQEMKSEVQAFRQELKSERGNEKNSFEVLLGNFENITHRISTLEVILQEATSERKNVSHSLAGMKTFLQEVKMEQENDFATTANNSKNKLESLDAIKAGLNITNPQKNCADLRVLGDELSGGVQTVYPYFPNQKPAAVYCDQVTDGGGWTVIQSRSPLPVRENFTRTWNEYVKGFGDPKGEFWLGLDHIHALTSSEQMILRVDLENVDDVKAWAQYGTFHVGDAASKYVLTIGNYSGDAGDGMISSGGGANLNAMKFSTFDNDNDLWSSGHCAKNYKGGWWFNACHHVHLNGVSNKIQWHPFRSGSIYMKKASMKIRPISFGV